MSGDRAENEQPMAHGGEETRRPHQGTGAVATAMLDQFTEYVDEGHAYMCSREVGTTVINAWRVALAEPDARAHCTTCGNYHPVIHHVCCANGRADRADLEQENERLGDVEALMPDVLILLDAMAKQQRDEYARGIAVDLRKALRDDQPTIDQERARALCEALGEEYEPRNRDEWRRSFAEMLPLVKARSDAWRTLLTRAERVDRAWLNQWRASR